MNCPSCGSPLQPGARFCGVCGHSIAPAKAAAPAAAAPASQPAPKAPGAQAQAPLQKMPAPKFPGAPGQPPVMARPQPVDPYVGQTLNNRFKVEGKLGEGGFGAVYKGVQVATGRKVAIKLLHPEMTRDDNLVARFKREGKVLCNLRDAHTITTYDFDQTPDGTLYLAMELLEGRSLHQVFHDEAPIAWQRATTILSMMCSSLAEAHAQGIVHRDLKPENIYLEKRPNHPEFVKVLDFGIAKVMRGEGSVDPHAPQLTATGQTLGTLEYMSPEQLMGKQLDGRSDIYALGVLAYELTTGRLPFPDAKGPAGLITAQLKQTPKPPSVVNPAGNIPGGVDRILLKCLEKDKNNRFADVSALGRALQECNQSGGQWGVDAGPPPPAAHTPRPQMIETRKGEPPVSAPPAMPVSQQQIARTPPPAYGQPPMQQPHMQQPPMQQPPPVQMQQPPMQMGPPPAQPYYQQQPPQQHQYPRPHTPDPSMSGPSTEHALRASKGGSRTWLFLVIGIVVLGGIVGAALALFA